MMPRFVFDFARPDDSQELLEMLEDESATGNIRLLYTRRPDAYASFQQEGQTVDLVVCRDRAQGKIVGCGACAIRSVFLNGHPIDIGYLFGLRVRREYRRKYPLLHRGYAFLHAQHQQRQAALYLNTILDENQAAQALLEKRRGCMPTYQPYGRYEIYAFKTIRSRPSADAEFMMRPASPVDSTILLRFLTDQGRQYQFFPVVSESELLHGLHTGLSIERFYLLFDACQELVAAGAIWDQTSYKQYIVQGYGGILRWVYPLSRWFPLINLPILPTPGSLLKFFTLSLWAVKDNHPIFFQAFLDRIATVTPVYPFFLVGIHERHPLRPLLRKRPHISYTSKIYLVAWPEQTHTVELLDQRRIPYLECGML